jgi:glycosyltransferase involved in cell wall biosynthesis
VLHVLGSGDPSGTGLAQVVRNLAANLDPRRYRLSVCFLGDDGPLGGTLREQGIDVTSSRWHAGVRDVAGARRFAGIVRAGRFPIVHLHAGGIAPRLVSRTVGRAKVVAHFHSLSEEDAGNPRRRRTGRFADLVIANSAATAATIAGCVPLVVYPGVYAGPRSVSRNKSAESVTIGVAARLAPVKGVEDLIAVFALVARQFGVTLDVVGAGRETDVLRGQAETLGIADRVRFLGWRDDVQALMERWDIYVQPSRAEGFGLAAVEAMAAGLPVVATDVGGLAEIVENGESGWLVAAGDTRAMAARLGELIADADMRRRMGDAGRARVVSQFSPEREAAAIQSAYDRLLA